MRARLLKSWPDLTYLFGVTPMNFDELTIPELNGYLAAVQRIAAQERQRPKR